MIKNFYKQPQLINDRGEANELQSSSNINEKQVEETYNTSLIGVQNNTYQNGLEGSGNRKEYIDINKSCEILGASKPITLDLLNKLKKYMNKDTIDNNIKENKNGGM